MIFRAGYINGIAFNDNNNTYRDKLRIINVAKESKTKSWAVDLITNEYKMRA